MPLRSDLMFTAFSRVLTSPVQVELSEFVGAVESATGDVRNFVFRELSLQTIHCCQQFEYNNEMTI